MVSVYVPQIVSAAPVDDYSNAYVLKSVVSLRNGPTSDSDKVGTLIRNTSLYCLDGQDKWIRILQPDQLNCWIRGDLVSKIVIRIHKDERRLVTTEGDHTVLSMPINPGKRPMENGRYFTFSGAGMLKISWPNRHDLREALKAGRMTYPKYKNAILSGPEKMAANQLSLCPAGSPEPSCGAFLAAQDYNRLTGMITEGARLEVYANANEDKELNQPDEFSRRILLGALKQLTYPAAGLRSDARPPRLSYPGGDIQPDFASSADIVIRAIRYAGADLQALVHEDILLHPQRYDGLDLGKDFATSHRRIPVLNTYFTHNAFSLSSDMTNDPFSFEAGDIVFFSSGETAAPGPDRIGIISETFNNAGLPLVITIWDMGQSTRKSDILGRKNIHITDHFRMPHLFDYQQ
jgi:uncharacterized protein YijF (DUF1287 family)